jgi:hypothetical protein
VPALVSHQNRWASSSPTSAHPSCRCTTRTAGGRGGGGEAARRRRAGGGGDSLLAVAAGRWHSQTGYLQLARLMRSTKGRWAPGEAAGETSQDTSESLPSLALLPSPLESLSHGCIAASPPRGPLMRCAENDHNAFARQPLGRPGRRTAG